MAQSKGLFVEVTEKLKEAINAYCEQKKCTIRQFVEQGADIILGAAEEEMVRLFVHESRKVYTVPLSLALIYESLTQREKLKPKQEANDAAAPTV